MTAPLVVGATGNVGSKVVAALRRRGSPVRAFVRDRARAGALLGDDVELVLGDLGDPAAVRSAVAGVDRLFLVCGNVPGQVALETGLLDAAAAAGVGLVVKLSALGAGLDSPLLFPRWQGEIEAHLRALELPSVVLRAGPFMSDLLRAAATVRATGTLFAPAAGAKVAMIDPRDIAAVAAVVLTGHGHEGRTYELTGPEAIDYRQVAEALTAATGRSVGFADVPDGIAHQAMLDQGLPEWVVDFVVALFGAMRAGAFATVTDTVWRLTGQQPRSIVEFARDHADAFRGDAGGTPDAGR